MRITTAGLLIFVVLLAAALAGCGGGSDLPGIDNAPATAGPAEAGLTCLSSDTLLKREAPADMDFDDMTANKGGGDASPIYSQPQIWQKGRWVSLKPYCGKRRFIGPSGVYRFVLMPSAQAATKGGIPAYAVYDQLPMRVRPQSENAWRLYGGYYTIRCAESVSFSLEIVSAPATGPLMRCAVVDPDRGVEYTRGAYGRYQANIGSRVLLLPAWYSRLTGQRVAPPAGALQASAWGDSSFLVSAGTQMFVVAGYPTVFSAGLSVSPRGGAGGEEYWYSTVRLDSRGKG